MRLILLILFGFFTLYSCSQKKILNTNKTIDSDLDGVWDYKDACPNEPGSPFNMGCPKTTELSGNINKELSTDTDLDGVPDDKDECPNEYGSPFNQGCP
jgi:hypothetical protein